MRYSIRVSTFIHKPWHVSVGGLNMRVAYPMNCFFRIKLSLAQIYAKIEADSVDGREGDDGAGENKVCDGSVGRGGYCDGSVDIV